MSFVAFVHPRRMARTYRADAASASLRAALADAGAASARVDVVLDGACDDARLAALATWLRTRDAALAVVEHGFSAPLLGALRAGGVRKVLALGRTSEIRRPGIDLAAAELSSLTLVELARRVAEGRPATGLPGVLVRDGAALLAPRLTDRFDPRAELIRHPPLWADEDTIGPPDPRPVRALLVDAGCPYRGCGGPAPALDRVALPPDMPRTGCAFCERPRATPLAITARLDLLLAQARNLASQRPEVTRVQVVDELAVAYLDRLADALVRAPLPPRDWLLSARPDWLLTHAPRVEAALARLPAGHRVVLFSVGIESFAARELALFHKGFGPDTGRAALAWIDQARARHANLAVEPAFGFVLFTPWTRLKDLAENTRALTETRFTRFREGVIHTRLRLYPEIALYHRARAEGLLVGDQRQGGIDYGYGDAAWRFKDAAVQRVHDGIAAQGLGGDDLEGLTRLVLAEIARRG